MVFAAAWFGALGILASAGALLDVCTRKLPNILCAIMLATGLTFAFVGGGWPALALGLAHVAAAFLLGYLFYLVGTFGAGDAKFYTATAGFFPLWDMLGLFVAITGAGFLLLLVWVFMKRSLRTRPKDRSDFAKLPYGVAIAAGAIAFAALRMPESCCAPIG